MMRRSRLQREIPLSIYDLPEDLTTRTHRLHARHEWIESMVSNNNVAGNPGVFPGSVPEDMRQHGVSHEVESSFDKVPWL